MPKLNPYFFLAKSDHPVAKLARKAYRGVQHITLPAPPRGVVKPVSAAVQALRASYELPVRLFVTEPLFKAQCKQVGRGVRCDVHLHRVLGNGDIILGDDVLMDGKITIKFGHKFSRTPTLRVGSHSGIGHGCAFVIGKAITIGEHCRVASGVRMFDSSGHPTDPARRQAGEPPADDDVQPINVGNNVWIGFNAVIFPGVTIGDGAVVSAQAVVMHDVPANSVVAGNPARQVSMTTKEAIAVHTAAEAEVVAVAETETETATVAETETETEAEIETGAETAGAPSNGAGVGTIIQLIKQVGDVTVDQNQDFYDAGFSSVRALQLLLELEDAFNTPIPDDAFAEARTPVALHQMIQQLSS